MTANPEKRRNALAMALKASKFRADRYPLLQACFTSAAETCRTRVDAILAGMTVSCAPIRHRRLMVPSSEGARALLGTIEFGESGAGYFYGDVQCARDFCVRALGGVDSSGVEAGSLSAVEQRLLNLLFGAVALSLSEAVSEVFNLSIRADVLAGSEMGEEDAAERDFFSQDLCFFVANNSVVVIDLLIPCGMALNWNSCRSSGDASRMAAHCASQSFEDIAVDMDLDLGVVHLSLAKLGGLGLGDTLEIVSRRGNRAMLSSNGTPLWECRLGRRQKHVVAQLIDACV